MSASGRTTEEIAEATRLSPFYVGLLLEDEQRRGHVERVDGGGWRLTGRAEQRFGSALRQFEPPSEADRC